MKAQFCHRPLPTFPLQGLDALDPPWALTLPGSVCLDLNNRLATTLFSTLLCQPMFQIFPPQSIESITILFLHKIIYYLYTKLF